MTVPASALQATVTRIDDQGAAGPCRARNSALRAALTPWVFLLDDDAFPTEGCLDELLETATADPKAAIVTPRILHAEEPSRIHYDGGRAHFLAELCLDNAHCPVAAATTPDSCPTAVASTALLVHRQRALDCGLFDEDLVFFREDLEFSLRLRAHGWMIRHCASAVVLHGRRDETQEGAPLRGVLHRRRTFYQTRNRWWIILKLWETRTILLTLPGQVGYELLNLGLALRRGELGQYAAAFVDLLRRLPTIRAGRKRFQETRRVPDRRLLGAPPLGWRPEVRALPLAKPLQRVLDAACRFWWSHVKDGTGSRRG